MIWRWVSLKAKLAASVSAGAASIRPARPPKSKTTYVRSNASPALRMSSRRNQARPGPPNGWPAWAQRQ